MELHIGQTVKQLRVRQGVRQETLAQALGVSTQAVSKWENQRAQPDIGLLPQLAAFFHVSLDTLFYGFGEDAGALPEAARQRLDENQQAWDGMAARWGGTHLPAWGVYIPTEQELGLLAGEPLRRVLEIACGDGQSLLYQSQRGCLELWGLDMSPRQIAKARARLAAHGVSAQLFVSPMEVNPGIPPQYFDCVYSVYGLGWTQDLDKTIALAAGYLKPGGVFIFSWDNPILRCLEARDGQYVLAHPYIDEPRLENQMRGERLALINWKLSSYVNTLVKHGLRVEALVEESRPPEGEAPFTETYYSPHKARYLHHSFVIKARKA